jgi:hypothetical protein
MSRRRPDRWLLGALLGLAAAVHAGDPAAAALAAQAGDAAPPWPEVAAVLDARCLPCHGGGDLEGELRLATAGTFAQGGSRGPVLVPDDLERSRLLSVVRYDNPDLAMPPDGMLPGDEIALLERWILAGAPWPEGDAGYLADPDRFPPGEFEVSHGPTPADLDWWAYRPLHAPATPTSSDPAWNEHPVDAHVRARLDDLGLRPAPQATPLALLRRATFTLTGLPPTPDEADAFLAAHAADADAAWLALIERLLDSPAYGEHQARQWLDLVRYGETNGYERDMHKTNIWRYRDWIVRAYERDLPYDRFVIEQLAGDELESWAPELHPGPQLPDPRLATGYYRVGVWDDEPADEDQARADELADIVDTTAQVVLGATFGCARCHDHKADPISQVDYYALTAWFGGVRGYAGDDFGIEKGLGMLASVADPPGEGQLTVDERDARLAEADARLEPHLLALKRALGVDPDPPPPTVILPDARSEPVIWRQLQGYAPEGWSRTAFDDFDWPVGQAGFGTEGTPGARVGTVWDGSMIFLRTDFGLSELPQSLVLSVHHDDDVEVFLNGVRVLRRAGYVNDYQELQLGQDAVDALVLGRNVIAVMCRQTSGGQYVDVGMRTGWVDEGDDVWRQRLFVQGAALLGADAMVEARVALAEHRRLAALPASERYDALVASERGGVVRDQHVLLRGSAHALGDVVTPAMPPAFRWGSHALDGQDDVMARVLEDGTLGGPLVPADDPDAATSGRRLALARWMMDEGRHVTARVAANRLWQQHFGYGLSRSPGDHGRFGEEPTDAALLDHLAVALIERDWSLKAMHRLLMTSRAWRMASEGEPAARSADPRNLALHHAEPRRLTAEQFRDAVLSVAGVIDLTRFGPWVTPPLPAEVLATASKPEHAWGEAPGTDAFRRTLYVHTKRTLAVPLLSAFDQPDPDLPCPERFPTNVPTQALMTLNGDFVNGMAERFAERVKEEVASEPAHDPQRDAARIRRAVELALGRPADDDEVARHAAFLEGLRDEQGLSDDRALALLCLTLFNLNEFLWLD